MAFLLQAQPLGGLCRGTMQRSGFLVLLMQPAVSVPCPSKTSMSLIRTLRITGIR
jgi:hypothetical protein